MKRPRYEIFNDGSGKWRWHLIAANGEIVGQGESYTRERDARRAVETFRRLAAAAPIEAVQ